MLSFSDLTAALTVAYVLGWLAVAGLALWLVPKRRLKIAAVLLVTVGFAWPVVQEALVLKKHNDAMRKHMTEAWGRFNRYCKEVAGDKIFKVVRGVEGLYIMKPRVWDQNRYDQSNQYWMGDPYGHTIGEARRPQTFFMGDQVSSTLNLRFTGYEFVEMPNRSYGQTPGAKKYLRWTRERHLRADRGELTGEKPFESDELQSRYGYTWDDISTQEDRKYWVAGGRLRILDLKTNEVVGERIGYMIDPQQGNTNNARVPWQDADYTACPPTTPQTAVYANEITRLLFQGHPILKGDSTMSTQPLNVVKALKYSHIQLASEACRGCAGRAIGNTIPLPALESIDMNPMPTSHVDP